MRVYVVKTDNAATLADELRKLECIDEASVLVGAVIVGQLEIVVRTTKVRCQALASVYELTWWTYRD